MPATLVEPTTQKTYFRGGRLPGTRNKVSTKCQANIEAVFNGLGGWESMLEWAKANLDTFYGSVYPKLLATEQDSKSTGPIRVLVYAPNQASDKPLDIVNGAVTQIVQAEGQVDEKEAG